MQKNKISKNLQKFAHGIVSIIAFKFSTEVLGLDADLAAYIAAAAQAGWLGAFNWFKHIR